MVEHVILPSDRSLQITEIFHSIQGESTFAGLPCVFVRLTGCSLRCTWCDTEYAFYGGKTRSTNDVLAEIQSYNCSLVEITGGEPLQQPAVLPFMTMLCDAGYQVLLETSGAMDTSKVDPRVKIILDVKCPGSGMEHRMNWENLDRLRHHDEVKFVIKDRNDYDWAVGILKRTRLLERCQVLFSPVCGALPLPLLAEWILADRLPVRFQLQLHKYIWDPDMRGV